MAKIKKATKKFKKKHLKAEVQKRKRNKHVKARLNARSLSCAADTDIKVDETKEGHFEVDEFADATLAADNVSDSSQDEHEDDIMDELDALMDSDGEGGVLGEEDGGGDNDEDDSDDNDIDNDELGQQNVALRGQVSAHRAQLEALKEQDPEFYEYLKSTDSQLLAFGEGEDEDDEGGEGEADGTADEEEEEPDQVNRSDAGEDKPAASTNEPQGSGRVLNSAAVERWCEAAKKDGTMGAMRYLLQAYRVACHHGDTDDAFDNSMRISSSGVYNRVLLFVLKEADGIFRVMLGVQDKSELTAKEVSKCSRWRKVEPLVKSFLGNTVHLLGQLTDSRMLAFILRRLRVSMTFLALQQRVMKKLLKITIGLFGTSRHAACVQSVLLLRQSCVTVKNQALDVCLKGVYRAFSSNAKFVSPSSMAHINFMAVCVIEMYGLDVQASYRHAFEFIRQLSVLLRSALTMKTSDSYRQVYCWQTINCMELWAKLLAEHADKQELRPLVFPMTQILLGAARLVPSPSFFPLRLRCLRALNRLSAAVGVFIPVAPLMLEMLTWGQLYKAAKGTAGSCPDLLLQLRLSKRHLASSAVQEEIVVQVIELLAHHVAQWSCSIAFPELSHVVNTHLRRFVKNCNVDRFRKMAKQLVDAIERNAAWVASKRSTVEFAPKDIAQVREFLDKENQKQQSPLQQYYRMLERNARQRRAAATSTEVIIGQDTNGEACDREEEEEEDFAENLLPQKKSAVLGVDKKVPGVGEAVRQGGKVKGKGKAGSVEMAEGGAVLFEEEDVVEDYILSDEEDDEMYSEQDSEGEGGNKTPGNRAGQRGGQQPHRERQNRKKGGRMNKANKKRSKVES